MPADFALSNPNAMFQGYAKTSGIFDDIAKQKAGQLLADGDRSGAVDTLNRQGDLGDAQNLQINLDNNDKRLQDMQDHHRALSTQMVIDTSHVLDKIGKTQGYDKVVPAFDQLTPMFKQRGLADNEIAQIRQGLVQNPQQYLSAVHDMAVQHMQQYNLTPGTVRMAEDGTIVGRAPKLPEYKTVGQNEKLVEVNPDEGDASNLPSEALQALKEGQDTTFQNGQVWTLQSGQPRRVK